jgi:4-alpha-glucanotransferase
MATAEADADRLADGLRRLSYEVLFLADPDRPDRFHPRIGLPDSALFGGLEPRAQQALRTLHDDFFYRRHRLFWEAEAMKKLPALMEATPMLLCGEDLGMIPEAVPVVLQRLGLLSLEVPSMPKKLGQRFGRPAEYPYLSVCTTSTHDTPTIRGRWEEDAAYRQAYYRDVMGQAGEAPAACTPEIGRFMVAQCLAASSMWCVLPLQDWLALDPRLRHPDAAAERINVPANPRHYWRYRLHLTVEELQGASAFNQLVSRLIRQSGRRPDR